MKIFLLIGLLFYSYPSSADWVEYATKPNGDIFFYDVMRVQKRDNKITVWNRIKFKTSVMAASSYQSLLRLDCSRNSATELQSTFFIDTEWTKPAMATNTNAKPEKTVEPLSTTDQLLKLLCK